MNFIDKLLSEQSTNLEETVKLVLYKINPSVFDEFPFEDSHFYKEPYLFSLINRYKSDDEFNLYCKIQEVFWAYNQNKSSLTLKTDVYGNLYMPLIGWFNSKTPKEKFELQGQVDDFEYSKNVIHEPRTFICDGDIEVYKSINQELSDKYYDEFGKALLHEWMIKEKEIVSLRDQPYKASHMTKQQTKVGGKQKKQKKNKYKITNWREYNRSLVKRGDITIWFDEALLDCWYYQGPNQKGAQYKYSGQCMRSLLQLKVVFGLKYRQLEGFASSLLGMMGIELSVPSYCQISRRAKQVEVKMDVPKTKGPMFIVFDSTGLKVYGEGEWKVRKHGYNKRRTWRKLHLGVDEKTGYIHAQVLTKNSKGDGDAQQVPQLLDQVKSPIDRFGADGAYDTYEIWEMLKEKQIEGVIPPQENAMYWVDENDELLDLDRNEIIKKIEKVGRKKWKQQSGYHRRSLSETAMFRFKTIFGPQLYSRRFETQQSEVAIKIACLNIMTGLGMPVCKKVA